jgi:hypothetical protein
MPKRGVGRSVHAISDLVRQAQRMRRLYAPKSSDDWFRTQTAG